MIDTVFSDKMKAARSRNNWTLEQLSEKTELTAAYLFDIESGRRTGSIKSLVKIAKALGLSLDEIYNI